MTLTTKQLKRIADFITNADAPKTWSAEWIAEWNTVISLVEGEIDRREDERRKCKACEWHIFTTDDHHYTCQDCNWLPPAEEDEV